jgi:DNA-binding response OmpR family regulator
MQSRILVVEDHHNTRKALVYQLRLAGYAISEASDGEAALDMLETQVFDLVLTDIVMGEVSGIEVLHTARMLPSRPAVILLTGNASLDTAIAAVDNGASAYLLKPCPTDELLERVGRAIQHHEAEYQLIKAAAMLTGQPVEFPHADSRAVQPSGKRAAWQEEAALQHPPLSIGALTIGSSRQYITFRGQPVRMTPIEFALLRCLAQQPGVVHAYSDIVRVTHRLTITDTEAQALLRPHVRNLRRKLGTETIVNERGAGYILVVPDV